MPEEKKSAKGGPAVGGQSQPQKEPEKKETPKEQAPKDEKARKVEVPEKFKKLVQEIEGLSVLDLAELIKVLEKKLGVSSAVPVGIATASQVGAGEPAAEEKTSFNVELTSAGDQKINVIKAVREITTLGLKEAKDLVDGAPKLLKENLKKEEAEEIKKKLEEVGATVDLK